MFPASRSLGPVILLLGMLAGPFATGVLAAHVASEHALASHGHAAPEDGSEHHAEHGHGHEHGHEHSRDHGHQHADGTHGGPDGGPAHDHGAALSEASPARPPVQSPELQPLGPAESLARACAGPEPARVRPAASEPAAEPARARRSVVLRI